MLNRMPGGRGRGRGHRTPTPLSDRRRNRDGTIRWNNDEEEGNRLVTLFTIHEDDPTSGADPRRRDAKYIRDVYNNNTFFSGPIEGANNRHDLRSFREGYRRLATEYLASLEGRTEHQANAIQEIADRISAANIDDDESLVESTAPPRPSPATSYRPQVAASSILRNPSFGPTAASTALSITDEDSDLEDFEDAVNFLEEKQDAPYKVSKKTIMPEPRLKTTGLTEDDAHDFHRHAKVNFKIDLEEEDDDDKSDECEKSYDTENASLPDLDWLDKKIQQVKACGDDIRYLSDITKWVDSEDGKLRSTIKIEVASGMTDEDYMFKLEDNGYTLKVLERYPSILLHGSEIVERQSNIPQNFAKAVAARKEIKTVRQPIDSGKVEELFSTQTFEMLFPCEFATRFECDEDGDEMEVEILPEIYKHRHTNKVARKKRQTVNLLYIELTSINSKDEICGKENVAGVIEG